VGLSNGSLAKTNVAVTDLSVRDFPVETALTHTQIIRIAVGELGVQEATGRNDGPRVEEYLRYTGLGKGHEWCAAFVSWCYGQAGRPQPRSPWSPALFPKARTYWKEGRFTHPQSKEVAQPADIFGIYGRAAQRINHVGMVRRQQGHYIITIEGNSNDKVASRRRHISTIYALADWVE